MNTPTLKEIEDKYETLCASYGHDCRRDDKRCPLRDTKGVCKHLYIYGVASGKRNLDGTLRGESGEVPTEHPDWVNEGALVEHIYIRCGDADRHGNVLTKKGTEE